MRMFETTIPAQGTQLGNVKPSSNRLDWPLGLHTVLTYSKLYNNVLSELFVLNNEVLLQHDLINGCNSKALDYYLAEKILS